MVPLGVAGSSSEGGSHETDGPAQRSLASPAPSPLCPYRILRQRQGYDGVEGEAYRLGVPWGIRYNRR